MARASSRSWVSKENITQKSEWVTINFERRNLNSAQKSHPLPHPSTILDNFLLKIKKDVTLSISCHKGIRISLRKLNVCFLWRFECWRRRVNSNYRIGYINCNYDRIAWNNRNYDERKQRHFSCLWWCFSVLGRTNAQKIFHKIILGQTI